MRLWVMVLLAVCLSQGEGKKGGKAAGGAGGKAPPAAALPPGTMTYGAWVPHPELQNQPQYQGHIPYSYHQFVSVPVAPHPVFVPPPHPVYAPWTPKMSHPSVHQCHACYELLLRFLYMRNMIQNQIDENNGRKVPDVPTNPFAGIGGAVPSFGQGDKGMSKQMKAEQSRALLQHFLAASGMPSDPQTMAMMTSPFLKDQQAIAHAGLVMQHANHIARMAARHQGMALPDGIVNVNAN